MSAASRRIFRIGSCGRLSCDSGVLSVKFALRVKILGELVHLLPVYKFTLSRLRGRRLVLYRALNLAGGARKISYEHKISFQIANRS